MTKYSKKPLKKQNIFKRSINAKMQSLLRLHLNQIEKNRSF